MSYGAPCFMPATRNDAARPYDCHAAQAAAVVDADARLPRLCRVTSAMQRYAFACAMLRARARARGSACAGYERALRERARMFIRSIDRAMFDDDAKSASAARRSVMMREAPTMR